MANPRTEKQARDVLNQFQAEVHNHKKPSPLNVTEFINFIAEKVAWDIEVVSWKPDPVDDHLRGMILRDTPNKTSRIFISDSDSNTECWKRFTAIKEVSHLFLRLDSHIECDDSLKMIQSLARMSALTSDFVFTKEIIQQIAERAGMELSEEDIQAALATQNPNGVAEVSAVAVAREVLMPLYIKSKLEEDAKTNTLLEMAEEIMVPAFHLEHRLNEWYIPIKYLD